MQTMVINTNGVHLNVQTAGSLDDPLLILLHGFPEFWYGWRKQIESLAAAGFRVFAPDQRGYNLSDKPSNAAEYTLNKLADDVVGLIDAAGRQKVYLVGHDWGGSVAWWVANKYPDRLEKLVILNTPHHRVFAQAMRTDAQQRRKSAYIRFIMLRGVSEILTRAANFWLLAYMTRRSAKPTTFDAETMQKYKTAWGQPGALTAMFNWYRAIPLNRQGWRPAEWQIHVPTLMLMGKHDSFFNWKIAEKSLELCDDGRGEYFEDGTHWLQHEEAEAVNRLMMEFFER